MKIMYNNKDIYKDISLNYAVHEMHAEGEADSLVLRFNDPKGLWSKWDPKTGDEISLEQQGSKTGKMFIYNMQAQNGLYTIRAMSMPMSMRDCRSASWQKVKLSQIAQEIASRHGLEVKLYDVKDQTYNSMKQQEESDIAFLSGLCMLEGCQLIIYDGQIIIYGEAARENSKSTDTIEIGAAGDYSCQDYSADKYGTAKVHAGTYSGEYSTGGSSRTIERKLHANSNAEATRFAKGLLRNANKSSRVGCVTLDFTAKYAAASVVEIKTKKAKQWNGKSFITKVRQDYVRNLSVLFFRGVTLEGY